MHYIYILNSVLLPEKFYVGYTLDVQTRLQAHNSGDSIHTKNYRPWKLHCFFAFEDKNIALTFEKYLKTHSGRAFTIKHFSKKLAC